MARDEVIQLDAETNRMKSRLESMAAAGSTDLQKMKVGSHALQGACMEFLEHMVINAIERLHGDVSMLPQTSDVALSFPILEVILCQKKGNEDPEASHAPCPYQNNNADGSTTEGAMKMSECASGWTEEVEKMERKYAR